MSAPPLVPSAVYAYTSLSFSHHIHHRRVPRQRHRQTEVDQLSSCQRQTDKNRYNAKRLFARLALPISLTSFLFLLYLRVSIASVSHFWLVARGLWLVFTARFASLLLFLSFNPHTLNPLIYNLSSQLPLICDRDHHVVILPMPITCHSSASSSSS